jgi:hypothetical protein
VSAFQPEKNIQEALGRSVSQAFKALLSEKHLYQSVAVDTGFLDTIAEHNHKSAEIEASRPRLGGGGPRKVGSVEQFRAGLNPYLQTAWFPTNAAPLVQTGTDILYQNNPEVQKYPLPTIKATCSHCDERGPFNPIGALVETAKLSPTNQWISLSYQCQNCKGEPIRFLVRRTGTKLTLSGRDPFETVEIPKFIPKQHAGNFRNALIANHAGQTLAGIFLMRVFVEQFWKSVPEVAALVNDKPRPTGDELAEAYKSTLPAAFKDRFPTLGEVYDSLSEAMHAARADDAVFEKCHAQIVEHFDARRLFKLVLSDAK